MARYIIMSVKSLQLPLISEEVKEVEREGYKAKKDRKIYRKGEM